MVFTYVNNECNRECPSCYWSNTGGKMIGRIASDSAKWIANICEEEKVKSVRINFLGGEPLLNIDTVFYYIDTLKNLLPKHTNPYPDGQFLLFTNGDYLSEEILGACKRRRVLLFLNPTYDSLGDIEDKIKRIKSICHGCSLSIVLDSLNMPRIDKIAKLAIKHNCHMRINRLYDGGRDPEYVKEYGKQMDKVLDLLLESSPPIWPNWLIESTYPMWEGPKNCYSCGKWLIIIDPDGTLRSCNADLDTKVGSIYTHLHWKELKMHQRWSAKNIPECQGCEWTTLCQAGCPYTHKLAYGDYNHPSPFCKEFKKLFSKLMEITRRYKQYHGLEYKLSS